MDNYICKKSYSLYKNILIITAFYIISHWYLCFLQGTFWDDTLYLYYDTETLWSQFKQVGRIFQGIWIQLTWNMPNFGYRHITFVLYYFTSILMYLILNNTNYFSKQETLILSIIYTVLPINDTRVCICMTSFTVGLFSFFLSFYLLTLNIKTNSVLHRILSLIFLVYSYTVTSIITYTFVMWMFIFFKFMQDNKNDIKKSLFGVIKYSDYIFVPIIAYFVKNKFFYPHGIYAYLNGVSIKGLIKAIVFSPFSFLRYIYGFFTSLLHLEMHSKLSLIVVFLILTFLLICFIRSVVKCGVKNFVLYDRDFHMLLFGFIIFIVGLFPYLLLDYKGISVKGYGARYEILLSPGLAFMLYYSLSIAFRRIKISVFNISLIGVIVLCVLNCNTDYLDHGIVNLLQESIKIEFSKSSEIKNSRNVMFDINPNTPYGVGMGFYVLNSLSRSVYGDSKRLIFTPDEKNIYYEKDKTKYKRGMYGRAEYNMNDYDDSYRVLDGYAVYNWDVNYLDVLAGNLYLMFDKDKYNYLIQNVGKLNFYNPNTIEYNNAINKYGINDGR